MPRHYRTTSAPAVHARRSAPASGREWSRLGSTFLGKLCGSGTRGRTARRFSLETLEPRQLLAATDVIISEVMYNPPAPTATEQAAGFTNNNDFEFIEIQNTGSEPISADVMGQTKLFKIDANGVPNVFGNQGVAFTFPSVALGAGEFAVVVKNATAFAVRYPGVPIAGQWSGGLSNNNEVITLGYGTGVPLWAQMRYDDEDPWPSRADGDGSSLQIIDKAFVDPDSKSLFNPLVADPFQGQYKSRNWMASRELKGSPGAEGLITGSTVVINEVLANTYGLPGGLVDTIELYNSGTSPVDLTDYYLTDSKQFALKYQIDDGTIIPAGGYVVFDGWDFDPTVTADPNATRLDGEFGLSSTNGETISLLSELNGTVILVDTVPFDASEPGVSFGRMPNGRGELFPNAERTFGQRNDGHLLSDLVISEINYHPADFDGQTFVNALEYYEYIEIHNRSDQPVDIANWRLRGDIDFPVNNANGSRRWLPSVTLASDERILVLRFDPATDATRRSWFESFYGITLNAWNEVWTPGEVRAVGEYWNLKPGQYPEEVPDDEQNPTNVDALSNRQGRIELQEFVTVTTDPDSDDPITLEDERDQFVLRDLVNYEDGGDWPNRADGNGSALELRDSDLFGNDSDSWRSSIVMNGTPGSASAGETNQVVINEVLAHTDLPLVDAIELFNVSDQPVDVGGWWLSDTNADLLKYQIPAGTTIPAGGYLVFDAWDFDPTVTADPTATRPAGEFGLSAAEGDDVWLTVFDTATGKPAVFADHVEFGPSFWGESFGRYPNGTGELFTNVSVTLGPLVDGTGYDVGLPNTGPKFGPVVITEILFDPGSVDLLEYVEIYNDSNDPVNLNPSGRTSHVGGGWRLDGFDFGFAVDTTLAPYESAVVVPFLPGGSDDATFRAAFNLDASVRLLGPATGRLNNAGETLKLVSEDDEPLDWDPGDVLPPYLPLVVRDEVDYEVAAPWPENVTGTGVALVRRSADLYGHFATSWIAGPPTPGSATPRATDDVVATDEDVPLDVDVLGNDLALGAPIDPTTVTITESPAQGTLAVDPESGAVRYTPEDDFFGTDSFRYTVANTRSETSGAAVVSIEVRPTNDPPTAGNDTFVGIAEDSVAVTLDVLPNDSFAPDENETLTIIFAGMADQGGLVTIATDGLSLLYTPAADFFGSETVVYRIGDGTGETDQASATIQVDPVNDDPVPLDDEFEVDGNSVDNILDVLANDGIGPDVGEQLTVTSVGAGDNGGTVSVADGAASLKYSPADGFVGTEVFQYTVSDGNGGTATATVSVLVAEITFSWQNPVNRRDTNNDSFVSPIDALVVINRLNTVGPGELPAPPAAPPPYYDVSGDGYITPIDALQVINYLNAQTASAQEGEGEPSMADGQPAASMATDFLFAAAEHRSGESSAMRRTTVRLERTRETAPAIRRRESIPNRPLDVTRAAMRITSMSGQRTTERSRTTERPGAGRDDTRNAVDAILAETLPDLPSLH